MIQHSHASPSSTSPAAEGRPPSSVLHVSSEPPPPIPPRDDARDQFIAERRALWDSIAVRWGDRHGAGGAYQRRLLRVHQLAIAPNQRVLELGCGAGDLLAALNPSEGVGVDLAPRMVELAAARHAKRPNLTWITADAAKVAQGGLAGAAPFDVIVLSDLLNDVWDVQELLASLQPLCAPHTRLVMNCFSRLWQWPLAAARRWGMARPQLLQSWLTAEDVENLLTLSGFELVRRWSEVLLPADVPLLAPVCNRVLAKFAPFRWFDLTNMFVARPSPASAAGRRTGAPPMVSVVVPARNEAGNIARIVDSIPRRFDDVAGGMPVELILVEGNSTDDTWEQIGRVVAERGRHDIVVLKQPGKGKGDAVRAGFAAATGDILLILDADLTVHPDTLPLFCAAIATGKGEFINGVRLVYPMEEKAMRLLNLIANRFFGVAFSWLLGQRIRDTLCGTKVIWRRDYDRLAANRAYFGNFDPFGDFDLIFGAAKLNLRILDLPVRYRERTYGDTNIHRWRHGVLLFRMLGVAMRRLKFV